MRITVVTVTFNAEETLERTLQSVAGQTFVKNVEHLVIDGASSDCTVALAQCFPHVRVFSEPDRGLYDAMNKALRLATGDYLVYLNAGDTLADDRVLERVATLAEQTHADVVYGQTDIVDGEGRFLRHRHLTAPENLDWRSFRHGMLVCHQSFYVRTDLARLEKYDLRYRYSADYDWCIRILYRARRLANTHSVLTHYLSEGMTTRHHRASLLERFRIMCRHYGLFPSIALHLSFVWRALRR